MKYYVNFFVHDSSLNDDFSDRKMIANHFLAIAILFFSRSDRDRDPWSQKIAIGDLMIADCQYTGGWYCKKWWRSD